MGVPTEGWASRSLILVHHLRRADPSSATLVSAGLSTGTLASRPSPLARQQLAWHGPENRCKAATRGTPADLVPSCEPLHECSGCPSDRRGRHQPGASVRLLDRFHPLNDLDGGAAVILKPHSLTRGAATSFQAIPPILLKPASEVAPAPAGRCGIDRSDDEAFTRCASATLRAVRASVGRKMRSRSNILSSLADPAGSTYAHRLVRFDLS